ncbi:MAG: signal peptidase II [Thermodesulfobacteriota bacterium]
MPGGAEITGRLKIAALTAAVVAAADQVSKAAVMVRLLENQLVEVVSGFFNIVYFRNPGAAFGFLGGGWGGTARTVLLIALTAAALIVVGVLLRQARERLLVFSLSLIAGGALGNLVDRVRFGTVVDFLDFHIGRYHWPAFNVADSAITVGVALALFHHFFRHQPPTGPQR